MANKTGQKYSETITFIRKRLHFDLLKTTVIALRGYRGKPSPSSSTEISALDLIIEPKRNFLPLNFTFKFHIYIIHLPIKEAPSSGSFRNNFRQHLYWKKLKYLHKYCLNDTQYFPLAKMGWPHTNWHLGLNSSYNYISDSSS